jgi:membrane protease YdiL (CAAX protease family)
MEVGLVYSLCFILSGTIWECVLLHAVNNFVSGFLSSTRQLDFNDPIVLSSSTFKLCEMCCIVILPILLLIL